MYRENEKLYIDPFFEELPSELADRLGSQYSQQVSSKHKKDNGQFFTPLPIAKLMASFCGLNISSLTILDPGCGTGTLTCTFIEHLIKKNNFIKNIDLVAYETDPNLISLSIQSLTNLKKWLINKGVQFQYILYINDFILDNTSALKNTYNQEKFDLIISNPPYFKLSKDDEKTKAAKELVSGQPNIYSFFMGIAAKLLKENGELIFITPRSFASGNYFKAFRELFFNTVQIDSIHLFNSRKATFHRDSVLQETVIIKAIKEELNPDKKVLVSSSVGMNDIFESNNKYFTSFELIDMNSKEKILHLPTNDIEEVVLNLASSWNNNLNDFNIQISTGPVVSFRALNFIQSIYENGQVFLAPLFWLHNVNKMTLEWPLHIKNKGQYIRVENSSKSLLIRNKNYIFLRRFSTKDDKSRLIAAPYFSNYQNSEFIGVENKVNYIYRKKGHLDRNEVVGLCGLLNSDIFNIYFQIFNGNVNVSASELREMRFPDLDNIKEIGDKIILSNDYTMVNVNEIVNELFEMENLIK